MDSDNPLQLPEGSPVSLKVVPDIPTVQHKLHHPGHELGHDPGHELGHVEGHEPDHVEGHEPGRVEDLVITEDTDGAHAPSDHSQQSQEEQEDEQEVWASAEVGGRAESSPRLDPRHRWEEPPPPPPAPERPGAVEEIRSRVMDSADLFGASQPEPEAAATSPVRGKSPRKVYLGFEVSEEDVSSHDEAARLVPRLRKRQARAAAPAARTLGRADGGGGDDVDAAAEEERRGGGGAGGGSGGIINKCILAILVVLAVHMLFSRILGLFLPGDDWASDGDDGGFLAGDEAETPQEQQTYWWNIFGGGEPDAAESALPPEPGAPESASSSSSSSSSAEEEERSRLLDVAARRGPKLAGDERPGDPEGGNADGAAEDANVSDGVSDSDESEDEEEEAEAGGGASRGATPQAPEAGPTRPARPPHRGRSPGEGGEAGERAGRPRSGGDSPDGSRRGGGEGRRVPGKPGKGGGGGGGGASAHPHEDGRRDERGDRGERQKRHGPEGRAAARSERHGKRRSPPAHEEGDRGAEKREKQRRREKREKRFHVRAPENCSGVEACAAQEFLRLFGKSRGPVSAGDFAPLLRAYADRLRGFRGWEELDRRVAPYFSPATGLFAHERALFRDFVEAVEHFLEDHAQQELGYRDDDDLGEEFDDFLFRGLLGDEDYERSKKAKKQRTKGEADTKSRGR
ncbi:pre-B-cell leukemia transcription factor-interacting protein 1 isoform X2 [Lethenteron reissneri]|uniref:pre-B-cell leukemia transcription factor-interacting protein 1 isoform X2 n=1 Tax=Lethenteron reissneri TaxID=7753 RepID=UPI002AB72DD6|nr:pre-B-cell leukemia transcription factor-interacting protein 1 isoform X2 [Lethenteron reissneri]